MNILRENMKDILDEFLEDEDPEQVDVSEIDFSSIQEELDLIESNELKELVKTVLSHSIYFWTLGVAPSNVEALVDMWPLDTYGLGGDLLNTKRVVRTCSVLADSYQMDDYDRDILIASAMVHTITKYIFDGKSGNVNFDIMYPYTFSVFLSSVRDEEQISSSDDKPHTLGVSDDTIAKIARIVRCHRGPWSIIPETVPVTNIEQILHNATQIAMNMDYIIDGESIIEERWLF
jgi:hypothetical protein